MPVGLSYGHERATVALAQAIVYLGLKVLNRSRHFRNLIGKGKRIQDYRLILCEERCRELLNNLHVRLGILGQLGSEQAIHALLLRLLVPLKLALRRRVLRLHRGEQVVLHINGALPLNRLSDQVLHTPNRDLGRRIAHHNCRLERIVASHQIREGLKGCCGLRRKPGGIREVIGTFHGREDRAGRNCVDPLPQKLELAKSLCDRNHPYRNGALRL